VLVSCRNIEPCDIIYESGILYIESVIWWSNLVLSLTKTGLVIANVAFFPSFRVLKQKKKKNFLNPTCSCLDLKTK
jgi:hypothetical protein